MMWKWRLWAIPSTAPSPCRRPSVGQRVAPRRQSARDRPGELFATPRRAIPRPCFASRYRRGSAGIPRKAQKEPARRTSSATPSAGCSSTPVSRVGAAEDMPRKTLDWSRSGERFATPSAGCSFRLGLDAEFPYLPSSGSHAPDQVPDSVTDIDRGRRSGCRSTAGP